ncbi:3-hydroxybenzoate 6-hydroxylase [Afipia felis]|uniref:3-hydroxybenzoate 6-hydroxylase n=1 Tax=Afipia felis TaxID=1035 RepID=A0A090MTD8_AFIFE|nr:3-hydroxybenzoate 6-hydroxylase [Afipia felis]
MPSGGESLPLRPSPEVSGDPICGETPQHPRRVRCRAHRACNPRPTEVNFGQRPGRSNSRTLIQCSRVPVTSLTPEHWGETIGDPAEVTRQVLAEFEGWDPALTALITDAEEAPILRPIYALPVEHRWSRVPGVTLLGDAAHLMSPFAGEGANLAMFDGAELAEALLASPRDIEGALTAYETRLFHRSASSAEEARRNLDLIFDSEAPNSMVRLISA